MCDLESPSLNLIAHEVIVYGDVLHAGMKDWVGTQKCGPNIVTEDQWW